MFYCQVTKRTSKPREKINRITVATREVEYKHFDEESEEEWFTRGTEIVREISACDDGVKLWEAMTPEMQANLVKSL